MNDGEIQRLHARYGEKALPERKGGPDRRTDLDHSQEPALLIVEAEMGPGKTEAALSLSARSLAGGAGDGITGASSAKATSSARFGLSRDIVIIHEVRAYDAYAEVLLDHLLSRLGALGAPVVLLSAVLPSERRAALIQAWRGDAGETAGEPLGAAQARPYPLVTVATRHGTELRAPSPSQMPKRRSLALKRCVGAVEDAHHVERVAQRLVEAAAAGARVVWIRNTVREAQRAFRAVASRAGCLERRLFHARFRACDRAALEQAVLNDFGERARPGGRVLVATPIVEQSLDLDFDELHTDLAPIDRLFQRAECLHRHSRVRPSGYDEPRLIVHVPPDADIAELRFGPSRSVYDVGTLWLSQHALRGRAALHVPADIRPLVEDIYHPASRSGLLPLGGPALLAAEKERLDDLRARQTKARQCRIPPRSADPDGGGAVPDEEDAIQALARDSDSVTLLPFWWKDGQARSLDQDANAAAWHLDPEAPDAGGLAGHLLDQTLSLPARDGDVEGFVRGPEDAGWEAWKERFARFIDDSGFGDRVVPVPLLRDRDTHKGWLRIGGRRRRVLYSKALGLLMPTERGEEQQG